MSLLRGPARFILKILGWKLIDLPQRPAKAVVIVDLVVMAVVGAKAAAIVVHAKSVQKAETTAGAIPTMFQHS
jgi:hypothetical protein